MCVVCVHECGVCVSVYMCVCGVSGGFVCVCLWYLCVVVCVCVACMFVRVGVSGG